MQEGNSWNPRFGRPQGQAEKDGLPPELRDLGVSVEDWAKLKGTLRSSLTHEKKSGSPQEYRGLVGDYFRRIAEEAQDKSE